MTAETAFRRQIYTNEGCSLYERFVYQLENQQMVDPVLEAVVGYFRSSGYFALKESLKGLKKIQVLVGINADRLSADWYRKAKDQRDKLVHSLAVEDLVREIEEAGYSPEREAGVKSFVQDVLDGRLELRAYADQVVHAKFYLFVPQVWKFGTGVLITGSSNFSSRGLGVDPDYTKTNYEMNVELRHEDALIFAHEEFQRLWAKGVELIPWEIAQAIKTRTYLNQSLAPRDLYYRFLYEVFQDEVDFDSQNIAMNLNLGYKKLNYQIDAVNEGLVLLKRHHGFFLADVVGLGKTVVGVLLIKTFLGRLDRHSKALVVAPPILLKNWQKTLEDFQIPLNRIDLVSSGNLKTVEHDHLDYALVVVDEAHRFRNAQTRGYGILQGITKGEGRWGRKKVILISATPVNNAPMELFHLINLFQNSADPTIPSVGDLKKFFQKQQADFDEVRKAGVPARQAEEVTKKIYQTIRDEVLSHITIRRTRSDLKEHPEYKNDLVAQGIKFPEPQKPIPLPYTLDNDLDALYEKTIRMFAENQIHFAYHKVLNYLQGAMAQRFPIPENTYNQLYNLLKQLFLKRLDSGFQAFAASLGRFQAGMEAYLDMLRQDKFIIANSVDVESFVIDEDPDGLMWELEKHQSDDPTITVCRREDFQDNFMAHLEADHEKVSELLRAWEPYLRPGSNPKLTEFLSKIDLVFLDPVKNPGGKVVVFTEAQDTAEEIGQAMEKLGRQDFLVVSAQNREDVEDDIRRNFDANYPGRKEDAYRILVTTDVLAEGVNLHRANTLVNYDTPWNSVRLFQRVGRVNRVGSTADKIYIYNFFPEAQIENQIELEKKARIKLQAFHSAFGEDAPIFSPHEQVEHFGLYNGVTGESEETNPRLALLMELRRLKDDEPEAYHRVVNLPPGSRSVAPGPTASFFYLRNSRRDAWYTVKDGQAVHLSLVEAAQVLKTDRTQALEIEVDWKTDLDVAQDLFLTKEVQIDRDQRHGKLGKKETEAVNYLTSFIGLMDGISELSAEEQNVFKNVVQRIKTGSVSQTFCQNVSKGADHAGAKKLAVRDRVDHLMGLIKAAHYHLEAPGEEKPLNLKPTEIEKPECVLSAAWRMNP